MIKDSRFYSKLITSASKILKKNQSFLFPRHFLVTPNNTLTFDRLLWSFPWGSFTFYTKSTCDIYIFKSVQRSFQGRYIVFAKMPYSSTLYRSKHAGVAPNVTISQFFSRIHVKNPVKRSHLSRGVRYILHMAFSLS